MARKISNKNYFRVLQKEIANSYKYVDKLEDAPKMIGGMGLEKISINPKTVFHFLEFIFEKKYVDLYRERDFVFIDNKINWEFLIKAKHGFLRVYDWKGYSVSVGACGIKPTMEVKSEARHLKTIIEEGVIRFLDFRRESSKESLNERPLDNFIDALFSLEILYAVSEKNNKSGSSLIESLIIFVSLIDTLLRYGILLTRVNKRKSTKVDKDLLTLFYQEGDEYLSERAIFKIAKEEINFGRCSKQKFFKEVNILYNERNKAVHRYAITNFQYIDIGDILEKYKHLKNILYKIVKKLEKEQANLGVGFINKDDLKKKWTEDDHKKNIDDVFERKINPSFFAKKQPKRKTMFE